MVFVIVLLIISLDQLSKFFICKYFLLNSPIAVIKGIFYLTRVHNRGAAFGILKNQTPLFIFTSLLAVVMIYRCLKENRHKRIYIVSLSLILAGAIGNLIDRLAFGYVIDFLDFRIWPVFNIADSSITVGVALLCWQILVPRHNAK
jgi:signal peptidase II